MVVHMMNILQQCNVHDIFISGAVDGFDSIPDVEPFCGPVQAIRNVIQKKDGYDGYIFVPVDMPLLTPGALRILMSHPQGGFFVENPLPFFLTQQKDRGNFYSVKAFLDANQVPIIPLPDTMQEVVANTNTPEEWEKILAR